MTTHILYRRESTGEFLPFLSLRGRQPVPNGITVFNTTPEQRMDMLVHIAVKHKIKDLDDLEWVEIQLP